MNDVDVHSVSRLLPSAVRIRDTYNHNLVNYSIIGIKFVNVVIFRRCTCVCDVRAVYKSIKNARILLVTYILSSFFNATTINIVKLQLIHSRQVTRKTVADTDCNTANNR